MTIDQFIKRKLPTLKLMIENELKSEFDSHEFIRHFSRKYELDYVDFLSNYKVKPFRTVNSQIATSLSKYADELGVKKGDEVFSESVFGLDVPNKNWIKTN